MIFKMAGKFFFSIFQTLYWINTSSIFIGWCNNTSWYERITQSVVVIFPERFTIVTPLLVKNTLNSAFRSYNWKSSEVISISLLANFHQRDTIFNFFKSVSKNYTDHTEEAFYKVAPWYADHNFTVNNELVRFWVVIRLGYNWGCFQQLKILMRNYAVVWVQHSNVLRAVQSDKSWGAIQKFRSCPNIFTTTIKKSVVL